MFQKAAPIWYHGHLLLLASTCSIQELHHCKSRKVHIPRSFMATPKEIEGGPPIV